MNLGPHCVIDIDGTLTNDGDVAQIASGHVNGNALFNIFRDLMVDQGWEPAAAAAALKAYAERVVFWDYPDFIREFKLPARPAWDRLVDWHARHLVVYDDAVRMIRDLHRAGLPLYISSNNPISGCLLKLHRAGLGSLDGAPLFRRIFGSNVLMGQKKADHWWPGVVAGIGVDPAAIVSIGDNPHEDVAMPRKAGIGRFCLVNRAQAETDNRFEDGTFFLHSLDPVAGLLSGRVPGPALAESMIMRRAEG